jgi:membrane protease YdiL (CAAX protease family)
VQIPPRRHLAVIPLHLIVFLAYNVAMSFAVLLLPTPWGLWVSLLLFVGVLHLYLLRVDRSDGRPEALLRLRPLPQPARPWVAASVPVLLGLIWAVSELYVSVVPVPPDTLNPFGPLLADPLGRLTIAVLAIGIAPVVEEFFFRGLIQSTLQERVGGGVAIAITSALFAAVHVLPWVFPLHFLLGAIFGWVVYVTRSIWSGVVLHAVNNAAAVLGMGRGEDPLTRPTIWDAGIDAEWWTAVAILTLSLAAATAVARGMRAAMARSEMIES